MRGLLYAALLGIGVKRGLGNTDFQNPVSYTHLDVYKSQVHERR